MVTAERGGIATNNLNPPISPFAKGSWGARESREGAGFLLICDRNRVLLGVQQTEEEGEHVRYEKAV